MALPFLVSLFVQLALAVASTAIGYMLMPKSRNSQPGEAADLEAPTAESGRPIPVVFGEKLVEGVNVIWTGDKGTKSRTVDDVPVFEYSLSMHMGVCAYGPNIQLLSIEYGGKEIYRGDGTTPIAVKRIMNTGLFGGSKKEGGVKGLAWWLPGAPDQRLPAAVYKRMGFEVDTHPGYRGLASLFFHGPVDPATVPASDPGEIAGYVAWRNEVFNNDPKTGNSAGFYWSSNSPYIKPVAVRVRRPSAGLPSATALIRIADDSKGRAQYASNPAHMIYECLTNTDWGLGENPAVMDTVAYTGVAQTLYNEGFGLNMIWSRQSTIESFIQEIQAHIRAVTYVDAVSGKHTIKLLRADYDANVLPVISPSNAVLSSFRRKVWGEISNEVTIEFTNAETGKPETVNSQDLAAIANQGGIANTTLNYYGIPSRDIAIRVADRELASLVAPLAACQATVSREFWDTHPQAVVRLQWPEYGIENLICRVVESKKSGASVDLQLVEDIFGMTEAEYLESQSTAWTNITNPPTPLTLRRVSTAPAFLTARALALAPADLTYPKVLTSVVAASDAPENVGYDLVGASIDVNGTPGHTTIAERTLAGTWVLSAPLAAEAQSEIGSFEDLRGTPPAAGDFVVIGDGPDSTTEIVTVQEITQSGAILNRGMLDTTPHAWPEGTRCWVMPADQEMVDPIVRDAGETVTYWLQTRGASGSLDFADTPEVSAQASDRPYLPNRPANVKVNGVGFGTVDAAALPDVDVTWARRNRLTETMIVKKWDDPDVAPEAGQTTSVEIVGPDGEVIATYADNVGTAQEVLIPPIDHDDAGRVGVRVKAVRSGLESLQSHQIDVTLLRRLTPPRIVGDGQVGHDHSLIASTYEGGATPTEVYTLRRNGIAVGTISPGTFTPAAGTWFDGDFLTVTGSPASYPSLTATSEGITLIHSVSAPTVVGSQANVSYNQNTGIHTIDVTSKFSGAGPITWSITGPADVDIADGVVSIPTSLVVTNSPISVYATNAGGTSAPLTFNATVVYVEPPVTKPAKIDADDVVVTFRLDPNAGTGGVPADAYTWHFTLTDPPVGITRLAFHGAVADPSMVVGAGFHLCIAHPTLANTWVARATVSADPNASVVRSWLWVNSSTPSYNLIGTTTKETLIYTKDNPATVTAQAALWSDFSDTLTQTCALYVPPTASASRRLPLMYAAEYAAGYKPGDCMQNWHHTMGCLSAPNRIYAVQDTGAVWASANHGRSWFKPRCMGLGSFQGLGVWVDPYDPNHVIVNMGASYDSNKPFQGIWESFDGCDTFQPRRLAAISNARRETHGSIVSAPSATSSGRSSKIFAVACGTNFPDDGDEENTAQQFPMARSVAGTWTTLGGTWAQATYGLILNGAGDPSSDDRIYWSTGKGLVCMTNAFSGTPALALMSGNNGLPTGAVEGPAYISANGQTIIVGVSNKGVYKTTGGRNGAFSKVGTHADFQRLWVNPYDPDRMLTTTGQNGTQTPYWSTNGGATFTVAVDTAANIERRPGAEGQKSNMIGNFVGVAWHTTVGHIFMHGRQTTLQNSANNYRTEDGGKTWKLANEGFCGANHGLRGASPGLCSATNGNRFMLTYLDLGPRYTDNGADSFTDGSIDKNGFDPALSKRTCFGACVHPDASRQRILAAVQESNPRLAISNDNGNTYTEIAGGLNGSYVILYDKDDYSIWYAGRRKSTNHGAAFTAMGNLGGSDSVCCATMAGTAAQAVFAIDLSGTNRIIKRSTDKGATWTTVLNLPWANALYDRNGNTLGSKWGPLECHPSNGNILFTRGPNPWNIRKWDLTPNTPTFVDLNLFGGTNLPPSDWVTDPVVKQVAIDRRTPNVMYAITHGSGVPRLYRTTTGGLSGSTPVAWEILDGAVIPQGCNINALWVNPLTGDCVVGGSAGTFVLKPPYAQSGTIFARQPYLGYLGNP